MKLKITHTGTIHHGHGLPWIQYDNANYFAYCLTEFVGQTVEVTVKGVKLTRSQRMNRYYWGVVIKMLCDFFNQENTFGRKAQPEFVHELLKVKFLGTRKIMLPGSEVVEITESSAGLTNTEFIAYFENVRAWALELLSLDIPLPPDSE